MRDTPNTSDALPAWYAVWTLSRAEFVTRDALEALGIETFLPTFEDATQWTDRVKVVVRPIFRGYLFARCARPEDRGLILNAQGVIDILPSSFHPLPVDAAELENVRRAIAAGFEVAPCEYVPGDAVLIDNGPLAGIHGIVQRTKNGTRVVVKIELLRRAVSVEVKAADVVKETVKETVKEPAVEEKAA